MKSMKLSTSDTMLMAPRLARMTPVGFPPIMSFSEPHRKPDEKFRFISHGSRPRADAIPPGLQTPPVRMWNCLSMASFSTSAKLTQAPWLLRRLKATTGPLAMSVPGEYNVHTALPFPCRKEERPWHNLLARNKVCAATFAIEPNNL